MGADGGPDHASGDRGGDARLHLHGLDGRDGRPGLDLVSFGDLESDDAGEGGSHLAGDARVSLLGRDDVSLDMGVADPDRTMLRSERSARLKSIPVDTSARNVRGLRAMPRSTLRRSMSPFGFTADFASSGSARCAGSLITRSAANGMRALAA
mgnify:CR=1 FL=1